jgi:hypothetical protein
MNNVFSEATCHALVERIERLSDSSPALWGKMAAAQMLAHCNVTYELVYTQQHPRPSAFVKFLLKVLVKAKVVNSQPYAQNSRTAPMFIVNTGKDFQAEKTRLIAYIWQTQRLGAAHFNGRESHSFGVLSADEWNNLFYKHLDHHLRQFAV